MLHLKFIQACCLTMLILCPCSSSPVTCAEDALKLPVSSQVCTENLKQFDYHINDMYDQLNDRSVAPWNYTEKKDVSRVPQVIHEANCLTSHSCTEVTTSASSFETIPFSIKIPVLRVNDRCTTFSLDFESVTIACLCATARKQ